MSEAATAFVKVALPNPKIADESSNRPRASAMRQARQERARALKVTKVVEKADILQAFPV